MSKFTIATRLADEIGVSIQKAARFVDDVGATKARRLADEAAARAGQTVTDWWKPVTAGGAAVGGGALAWRQQDIEAARAIASQQQDYSSALAAIMDSDLSPKAKQEMADALMNNAPSSGGGGGGGSGEDGGLLGGDLQTTLVVLIVLVLVVTFALGEVSS